MPFMGGCILAFLLYGRGFSAGELVLLTISQFLMSYGGVLYGRQNP